MKKRITPIYLGPFATLIAAVLLSGIYTVLCLWTQPNRLLDVANALTAHPMLIVLNALPIGLLILTFTFLLRNVFASAALVGGCCAALSFANRIKIQLRDEPVIPRDLVLAKEVFDAVENYEIHWPVKVIAIILLVLLVTIAAAVLFRCKPFPTAFLKRWWGRAIAAIACFAALLGLVFTVYASDKLYQSFPVTDAYHFSLVFNELGFPYCFTHNLTTYTVDKPENYSRSEAENWENVPTVSEQGENVHVIMVMNEAYSDIVENDSFAFTDDPLENLHRLQQDAHAITGHLVVPGFAGGTANTEFDVLTGMQTRALSPTTTSAMQAVSRNLDSLYRVFGADGYATSFFHPGNDWFYNRENVYRMLGAEKTLFMDEMQNIVLKGWWPSDDYMAGQIESEFESAVANGEYLFNYTTTIQNHMSYVDTKYGPDYTFTQVPTAIDLSDEVQTMFNVYVDGLRDADAMLGRLHDYFALRQEPVILVFFGDHLPYLGNGQLGYSEIHSEVALAEEDRTNPLCVYETPYVIWANDAAVAALDWNNAVSSLSLPNDHRISACYLGSTILELTGRGQESPWFAYLNTMRRALPVMQLKLCVTADGTVQPMENAAEELQSMVAKHRRWSYYKLKQKEVG